MYILYSGSALFSCKYHYHLQVIIFFIEIQIQPIKIRSSKFDLQNSIAIHFNIFLPKCGKCYLLSFHWLEFFVTCHFNDLNFMSWSEEQLFQMCCALLWIVCILFHLLWIRWCADKIIHKSYVYLYIYLKQFMEENKD